MRLPPQKKADNDTLDYDIDFTDWLNYPDTVVSATAISDEGITIENSQVFDGVVKVWVSGGKAGNSYNINVTATTNEGRVVEVCFNLRVTGC